MFLRKSLSLAEGERHTYAYIHEPPKDPNQPTLAFFHGFPSTADDWRHQLQHFSDRGYGVFAPDLLGYGGTSKPSDVFEYRFSLMVKNVISIMDHEGIGNVHGVAHDFGSHFLSRLYNYQPGRILSLTFIAVPYTPSGIAFDVQAVNARTEKLIGFQKFGYMEFLASDASVQLLEDRLDSFQSLVYEADATLKADQFYPPGKLEAWLKKDCRSKSNIINAADQAVWVDAFRHGGLRGPTNWYRALLDNVNKSEEDESILRGEITIPIKVPVLGIDSQPDHASLPGFMEFSMKPFATQLQVALVQSCGHWPHLVSSREVNQLIQEHIQEVIR